MSASSYPGGSPNPRLSVLVAHGAPHQVAWLEEALRPVADSVKIAASEEELTEALRDSPPDVLIVDEGLPPRGGLTACQELRGHPEFRGLPVLALVRADAESAIRAYAAGCDDALALPTGLRTLVTRVEALARLHRGRDMVPVEAVVTALLEAMAARDPDTRGHGRRMASLAFRLGQWCGLPPSACQTLWLAALTHDIGKLGLPDHLLRGTTPLTPSDWELIRQHPVVGEAICRPLATRAGLAEAVRHHHERWDGQGYPDGLRQGDIPLFARMLFVVDAYDAITTERPYRPASLWQQALQILHQEAGRQFDPAMTAAFAEMLQAQGP